MKKFALAIISLLFCSCSTWKNTMAIKGNQNDAVQNAIFDFLHSGTLSKKDSVFSISIENINGEILGISILGNEKKLAPNHKDKIGAINTGFPTRYFEKNDKLFYWCDPTYRISSELISTLSKYKLIDSLNVNGFVGIPEYSLDDAKKAEDYYFCRNNLRNYKKVSTSIAMGWYAAPKLDCSNK